MTDEKAREWEKIAEARSLAELSTLRSDLSGAGKLTAALYAAIRDKQDKLRERRGR